MKTMMIVERVAEDRTEVEVPPKVGALDGAWHR